MRRPTDAFIKKRPERHANTPALKQKRHTYNFPFIGEWILDSRIPVDRLMMRLRHHRHLSPPPVNPTKRAKTAAAAKRMEITLLLLRSLDSSDPSTILCGIRVLIALDCCPPTAVASSSSLPSCCLTLYVACSLTPTLFVLFLLLNDTAPISFYGTLSSSSVVVIGGKGTEVGDEGQNIIFLLFLSRGVTGQ